MLSFSNAQRILLICMPSFLNYIMQIYIFLFLKNGFIVNNGGIVSPKRNPQGFRGSIWSKMSFTMARSGMERNIPGMPHKAFPTITTIMEKSALILTFDATILGTM